MIFYEQAVALNRERHQKLKIQIKPEHFSFAAQTNSVLLAGSEFSEASRDYPIVFVGQEGGPFTVAVLVGLTGNENLMVSANGTWENGAYIPAFIRRYPFVLAGADDAESLTVCIDEAYSGLTNLAGEPLFSPEGGETEYLKNVVEFLRVFHAEMKRTSEFASRVAALGLLAPKVVSIEFEGVKKTLDGLWVIDEEKLNALDDAQTLELVRSGYMGLIYAHFFSLKNVARLAGRLDGRRKSEVNALSGELVTASETDVVH